MFFVWAVEKKYYSYDYIINACKNVWTKKYAKTQIVF